MKTVVIRNFGNHPMSYYTQFLYPAGEMQVRIKPEKLEELSKARRVVIVAEVTNGPELIELYHLVNAVSGTGKNPILVLPYLPYGRADRQFVPGDCVGIHLVQKLFNDVWNIVTLDQHSVNDFVLHDVPATPLIEQAISHFYLANGRPKKINILFPDQGAEKRYRQFKTGMSVGCNVDAVEINVLHASKVRNPKTGKIEQFAVPRAAEFAGSHTLIVDDIGDGCGTFLGIRGLLPAKMNVGLYVTHGIFSKGFRVLEKAFSRVYTTTSCKKLWPNQRQSVIYELDYWPVIKKVLNKELSLGD